MNRENETTEIEWALTNCGDKFIKLRPEKEKWVNLKISVWLVVLFRGCLVQNGQHTKPENKNAAGSIIWTFASQRGLYADGGACFVLIHHQPLSSYQRIFLYSSRLNQNYLEVSPSLQDSLCSGEVRSESSQTVEDPEFSSPWLHTLATELSHVREERCTVTTLLEERITFSRFCC